MTLTYYHLNLAPYEGEPAVAAGISGGPDSTSLAWLLKEWAADKKIALHLLTVDHGLRPESLSEAQGVGALAAQWPGATHRILTWQGGKPPSRIAEAARAARYALMEDYCRTHDIRVLFLGHHQDDQAETFLFRLAKGSGLDGLAAMQAEQSRGSLRLVRPLLAYAKDELEAVCIDNNLPFVRDPSNENNDYARPRLRAARAALEAEGLSAKRLSVTASRMARARGALERIAAADYARVLKREEGAALGFDEASLRDLPEEIALRVILKAMAAVSASQAAYPARLEKVEQLVCDLLAGHVDKTHTLGGCLFVPDPKNGLLWVKREGP